MGKKNLVNILIFSCCVILIGLVAIQYYLIRNSYNLQKEEYVAEVKKSIDPLFEAEELDALEDSLQDAIRELQIQKIKGKIDSTEFQKLLRKSADSICDLGNKFLKQQEEDYPILKKLKIRNQFYEIVFKNDTITDTILRITEPPLVLLGQPLRSKNLFNINVGNLINKSDWLNGGDIDLEQEKYMLTYKHSIDIDISNWQQKVLSRMAWMLVMAIVLILAVVALFFWMYRALIKQRKIAEIKTDFANNITHELKTPLTSLNLIVKSLQKEEIVQNPEMLYQLIQSMGRQNNRIQNIFDRVLESTVENQKIHVQELEIVQFLNEFMMDYSSETHQIKTDFHPATFILETDSYQLGRVLQNILQNAEKYSPEAKEIFVKAFPKDEFYEIQIQDFGKGIPSQEQKKIFEKFYRISEGNIHNVKGLGLGLFLSQEIIKSLKGEISVESQQGKGSTFTIKIPLK